MFTRRQILLFAAGSVFAPARAFPQSRIPRVCMLSPRPLRESNYAPEIIARLGELGYRDGSTMHLDYRSADGHTERYATLALGLIGTKCDVMVTLGTEPTVPFREAHYPVPLVFLALDADPLERRLVKSLRSPGVNATGVYKPEAALVIKRFELARELYPQLRHVMVFSDTATRSQLAAVRNGAKQAGLQLTVIEFATPPYNYEPAFSSAGKARIGVATFLSSPVFSSDRAQIAALQAKYRLPAIGNSLQHVNAGFLISLHADQAKMSRRAAELAVRVLKGTNPADIPIEQADEFELVINAKTAKALGVKMPQSVLARATQVVQ